MRSVQPEGRRLPLTGWFAAAEPLRKVIWVRWLANATYAAPLPFAAVVSVVRRRIVIVDDVMTTGATADECARVLKRAGAAFVGVLTLARALRTGA